MKNKKLEKYHFEEIVLILLILATDLSNYDENNLELFGEDIEGRIESLFTKEFLNSLDKKYGFDDKIIFKLEELKLIVINLYESNWIKKLTYTNIEIDKIKIKSISILKDLKISYVEPEKFAESHLNIEW
ncbi:hypothetical protein H9X57_01570 [Flavobacterium piscinae]|uniref:Uncharacterized protein n=1 Tax=Flavobacterium piscinae TaxID=2506424 RepID=A0A4Q1KPR1_9FLAO|nr:hypothetical protein [Flavobacterium piscinae]MBC8882563.1 hypothetical protein [Flavobacterium piscinae]RXR31249.1 hypothetical protein EQG68_10200 [Flavobacterium piscinae]